MKFRRIIYGLILGLGFSVACSDELAQFRDAGVSEDALSVPDARVCTSARGSTGGSGEPLDAGFVRAIQVEVPSGGGGAAAYPEVCGPLDITLRTSGATLGVPRSRLFKTEDGLPIGVGTRLANYCVLDIAPDLLRNLECGDEIFLATSTDTVGLVQTQPQTGGLLGRPEVWGFYYDRFLNRAGAFDVTTTFPAPVASRARLAVLDSAPTRSDLGWTESLQDADFEDHGVSIARIGEELICPDGDARGSCTAELVSENIFASGGTLGDLAVGLVRAVDGAKADPQSLIINLSVGWVNTDLGGDSGDIFADASETPAAAAVHEALQYARCRGASIFAAAGNRTGVLDGEFESGPIRPAHWNTATATGSEVTGGLCQDEFPDVVPPLLHTSPLPLVTSVGAVNERDTPLSVSRKDSGPDLLVDSLAAIAETSSTSLRPTALLSGTSVGPMVAAAAVSALRQSDPTRSVQEWEEWIKTNAAGSTVALNLAELLAAASTVAPTLRVADVPAEFDRNGLAPIMRMLPDDRLECPFGDTTFTVVSASANSNFNCGALEYTSADQDQVNVPQPNPTAGGCPGCPPSINFSEGSGDTTVDMIVQVEESSNFMPTLLELTDAAQTIYLMLPDDLVAGTAYEISFPPLQTELDFDTTVARIIMVNEVDQLLSGVEAYVTREVVAGP